MTYSITPDLSALKIALEKQEEIDYKIFLNDVHYSMGYIDLEGRDTIEASLLAELENQASNIRTLLNKISGKPKVCLQ